METMTDLRVRVSELGGVLQLQVRDLRDLVGAARAGVKVRRRIEEHLEQRDLVHLPLEIPDDQEHWVLVAHRHSPEGDAVARLQRAVHEARYRASTATGTR